MKKTLCGILLIVLILTLGLVALCACSLFKSVYITCMNGDEMIQEISVGYGKTNNYVKSNYLKNVEDRYLEKNNLYIEGWYTDASLITPVVFDDTKVKSDITWYAKCKSGDSNRRPLTYNYRYGSGTQSDPYLIKTPEDLDAMRYGSDLYHKLDNDLNLSEYSNVNPNSTIAQWKAIETYDGHFDGNNHTISGINFHNMTGNLTFIELNIGEIKNLNLKYELSLNTNKKTYLDFICKKNKGVISSCSVSGRATLIGFRNATSVERNDTDGQIINCKVNMQMYISDGYDYKNYMSLLVGDNYGRIKGCAVTGLIEAKDRFISSDRYFAGLVNYNQETGVIEECGSKVDLCGYGDIMTLGSPLVWVGGLTTVNYGSIKNCFYDGHICLSGAYARGAGLAAHTTGFIKYCYSHISYESISSLTSGTHKFAPAFIAGDSNQAQVSRCEEVIYGSDSGANNFSNAADNEKYAQYVKKKDLYSAQTFAFWDFTIWNVANGKLPTLKNLPL